MNDYFCLYFIYIEKNQTGNMIEKSLIICYSTPNYETLANICLTSLESIGVPKQNIIHKVDHPPEDLMRTTGFMTDLFYYCICHKVEHLIETLRTFSNEYEYYISLDMDIWFIKKHTHLWMDLENYITQYSDKDVFFMRENGMADANGGFFIIKNDNILDVIAWLQHVYDELLRRPRKDLPMLEQQLINETKHIIRYEFIPDEYVIWGKRIYNPDRALFHHAVCCYDTGDKLCQIGQVKKKMA